MTKRKRDRSGGRSTVSRRPERRPAPRRMLPIALGVLLVAALGTAVLFYVMKSPGSRSSRSSTPSPATPVPVAPFHWAVEPNDPQLPSEQKDRRLRQEQLDVVRRLVEVMPASADALFLLAMAYQEQGNGAEATRYLQHCLERQPGRADAYDQLGRIAHQEGEHEKAVAYFEKARQSDPRMPGVDYRLGEAYRSWGKADEAIAAIRKNVERFPEAAENHVTLGELYLQKQDYEAARTHYTAALELNPDLPKAHYGLATAWARLGQREQAVQHRQRFQALEAKGREAAREQRSTFDPLAVTCQSVSHTHTDVARVLKAAGQDALAVQLWHRAVVLDPNNVTSCFSLADHYFRANQLAAALPWYQQVTQCQPDNGVAYLFMGQIHEKLNRPAEAERAYTRVTEVAPDRPEGFLVLARFLWEHNGDLTRARRLAQRAVTLAPIAANHALLARVCHKLGDRAGALAAASAAVRLAPRETQYARLYRQIQENR